MPKINKIKIKLKSGLLTDLQSDTIFGHFCWRFREIKGEEDLTRFLDLYLQRNPIFTVSNSFYEYNDDKKSFIFLPRPLVPIDIKYEEKEKNEKNKKKKKVIDFLKNKCNKKLSSFTLNEFNYAIKGDNENLNSEIEERMKKNTKFEPVKPDLRVSVEIDRNILSNKKGQLFSYAPSYLNKDYSFVIFVKIIDEKKFNDFNCKEILKETFELGFGKKKSSGYGELEFISFEEFSGFIEPSDSNGFITLSNYLPSEDDGLEDYSYDFHVKYGKLGEEYALSKNPFKKPIILIKPGSTFKTKVVKDFYGRCTGNGEISTIKEVIQNGIAFTLRMKI